MKFTTLLLTFLLGVTVAFAQQTPKPAGLPEMANKLAGKYEGMVKDQRVVLELNADGSKSMGRLQNGENSYEVTEAVVSEGKLTIGFGKEGKLLGKIDGDKIIGDLWLGTQKSPIELKRVPAAAAATPAGAPAAAPPSATAVAFNLNGDWDAVADANGQPFPFALTLKVEGEKVTGGSSSQLGEATIKEGTWKDGKLMLQLQGQNGVVGLTATVVDGKLTGEYDYAGQLEGKWVAVKKQ